jgi:hypothetical protein
VLARVGPVGGLQQQAQPQERPHQVRRSVESRGSDPDPVHFGTRYPDLMYHVSACLFSDDLQLEHFHIPKPITCMFRHSLFDND